MSALPQTASTSTQISSIGLSPAQKLYHSTLQKALIAELEFLMDIVQGRITDRKTIANQIKEKLVQGLGSLLGQVPLIGNILNSAVKAGGEYLLNELEKKKRDAETEAVLQSFMSMDKRKIEIMANDCAREAACRWEMAINQLIENKDNKALTLFAFTGAIRILEYLQRKRLPITVNNLLGGLIMGRSGSGHLSSSNTQISLTKALQSPWGEKELSAEGLYGRAGYIVSGKFFVQDLSAGETEDKIRDKRKAKRGEFERHFGYVKFFKKDYPIKKQLNDKRPKFGYVQMAAESELTLFANPKTDGYGFTTHQPHASIVQLYYRENRYSVKARFVSEKEIYEYLAFVNSGASSVVNSGKRMSLNEYIGAVAYFRGTLKGSDTNPLDLTKANFSESDFSRATFENCILGSCRGTFLTGATLCKVRASHDSLDSTELALTTIIGCDFTGLKAIQTNLDYANITYSRMNDVLGTGLTMANAVIDDTTRNTFGSSLKGIIDATLTVVTTRQVILEAEQKKVAEDIQKINNKINVDNAPWDIAAWRKKILDNSNPDVQKDLELYIPASGRLSPQDDNRFDLLNHVYRFLNDHDAQVLLLLGGSGSGKSLFGQYLTRELCRINAPYIPIWVSLPSIKNRRDIINEALLSLGISPKQIETLRTQQHFLWILDGYDEIQDKTNLINSNNFGSWKGKVAITCRSEYLMASSYRHLFVPSRGGKAQNQSLWECHMAPFSSKEIDVYLQQHIKLNNPPWKDANLYHENIEKIPGIKDLIETPFLLRIIAEVLPEIVSKYSQVVSTATTLNGGAFSMTRRALYDAFVKQWFDNKILRLSETGKTVGDGDDPVKALTDFCRDLALEMCKLDLDAVQYKKGHTVWDKFFRPDPEKDLLRWASPLKKTGDSTFSFLHKSLLEYFIMLSGVELLKSQKLVITQENTSSTWLAQSTLAYNTNAAANTAATNVNAVVIDVKSALDKPPVYNSVSAAIDKPAASIYSSISAASISATIDKPLDKPMSAFSKPINTIVKPEPVTTIVPNVELLNHPLNQKLLNSQPAVIRFLADALEDDPSLQTTLWGIIERSKQDASIAIASANAATVLNAARISFTGKDLRGARIAGADLSHGVYDSTDFTGADCRNVELRGAWLANSNFSRAKMQGVNFGELPYIKIEAGINCCSYSSDGRWLAIGSNDNNIYLYEVQTQTLKQVFKGHTGCVKSIALSRDGTWMVSGGEDYTARLWHCATGITVREFHQHTSSITSVALSTDAIRMVSGSLDGTAILWDCTTGKALQVFQDTTWVKSVALSGDATRMASGCGGDDGTIRLWDCATGKTLKVFQGHRREVLAVAFSRDVTRIVSGGNDYTVRLWDCETGEALQVFQDTCWVMSVDLSSDMTQVVSGNSDGTIRCWDCTTGKALQLFQGHNSFVVNVTFSEDMKWIASGSWDKTARIWKMAQIPPVYKGHTNYVTSVVLSQDATQIISGSYDSTARLWDCVTGKTLRVFQGHLKGIADVALSGDGTQMLVGSYDGIVRIWDCATGKTLQIFQHTSPISKVALSMNATRMLSLCYDSTIHLWDCTAGKVLQVFNIKCGFRINCVSLSMDTTRFAAGDASKSAYLLDCTTNEILQVFQGHLKDINSVTLSMDAKRMISGSADNTARLWDCTTGKTLQVFEGHTREVRGVALSRDGTLMVSGSSDRTVRIWDCATGKCMTVVDGFTSEVLSVSLLQNLKGLFLAVGSYDCSVQYFQIKTNNFTNQIKVQLLWNSHQNKLFSTAAQFEGALLSSQNASLVQQRGGAGKPQIDDSLVELKSPSVATTIDGTATVANHNSIYSSSILSASTTGIVPSSNLQPSEDEIEYDKQRKLFFSIWNK